MDLTDCGHKIAVLTVDPSSISSGGKLGIVTFSLPWRVTTLEVALEVATDNK